STLRHGELKLPPRRCVSVPPPDWGTTPRVRSPALWPKARRFRMYRRNLILGVIASSCFGIGRAKAWSLVTRQQQQRENAAPHKQAAPDPTRSGAPTKHNKTDKIPSQNPSTFSGRDQCKNCGQQPACYIWVPGNRHHETITRTCKANSIWSRCRKRRT